MRYLAVKLISLYQATLSPDHGWFKVRYPYGFCKFYPSCSEYAKEAIVEKGVVYGSALAVLRIVRCNPFSRGGIDKISTN